jgi:hypothetical protein
MTEKIEHHQIPVKFSHFILKTAASLPYSSNVPATRNIFSQDTETEQSG